MSSLFELEGKFDKLDEHFNVCLERMSGLINRIVLDLNSLDERLAQHGEICDKGQNSQDQLVFSIQDRLFDVEREQLEIRTELFEIKRRLDELAKP